MDSDLVPKPATPSVTQSAAVQDEDRLWQRKLLPFMVGSIIFVAIAFLGATFWFFSDVQQRLEFKQSDVLATLNDRSSKPDHVDQPYRDWYVRAALEQTALQQRFNVQTTVVKARLWTRLMGFMTGMLLALTGCVFVLGKLRESIDFRGESKAGSAALLTSSPGVFLALLGTVLIGISLTVQVSVESTDAVVYLPRQVQGLGNVTASEMRSVPPPVATEGLAADPGAKATPMPASVQDKIKEISRSGDGKSATK